MKKQNGFTIVGGLLFTLVLVLVCFVGWYVWDKQSSKNDTTSSEQARSTDKVSSNFTTDQEIYDQINKLLTTSSIKVTVGVQTFDSPDISKRKFAPGSMQYPQDVPYISSKFYTLRKACSSDCGELLTDEGHLSAAYTLSENDFNIVYNSVKESFIYQQGVELIDSGSEPTSYITSNYLIVNITKTDGSKIKLEVSTGANDGGQYISAHLY